MAKKKKKAGMMSALGGMVKPITDTLHITSPKAAKKKSAKKAAPKKAATKKAAPKKTAKKKKK